MSDIHIKMERKLCEVVATKENITKIIKAFENLQKVVFLSSPYYVSVCRYCGTEDRRTLDSVPKCCNKATEIYLEEYGIPY